MADATRIPSLPASSWRRLAAMLAALLFFVAAVLPPLLVFLAAALHHGGARGTTAVADAMRWSGAQGRGGATGDAGPWPQGGQQTRRDGGVPARSNLGMADLAPLPCWLR
uniref:Uncharacterized protein n=1 Tax=Arundo donax TaxID=35708 RepID=A0A0A9GTD3_ARUDO